MISMFTGKDVVVLMWSECRDLKAAVTKGERKRAKAAKSTQFSLFFCFSFMFFITQRNMNILYLISYFMFSFPLLFPPSLLSIWHFFRVNKYTALFCFSFLTKLYGAQHHHFIYICYGTPVFLFLALPASPLIR